MLQDNSDGPPTGCSTNCARGGIWVLGMLADGNADNKPREV